MKNFATMGVSALMIFALTSCTQPSGNGAGKGTNMTTGTGGANGSAGAFGGASAAAAASNGGGAGPASVDAGPTLGFGHIGGGY